MKPDDPVNILVVDDNAANLQALEAILESPQFRLVRATSGDEALRHVLDTDFAAILLDVMMPGMDGFETARLIRERERSSHIPIIFLTAIAKDKRYQDLGYERGAVDYLTKPLDEFALKAKVAVFADLFRVKETLRETLAERERLTSETKAEHEHQIEEATREQSVLDRFTARQTTRVTAALHGEKLVSESAPDVFAHLVERYMHILDLAVDSRVHTTEHDLVSDLQSLATKLAFLGAGPRDVVDLHKAAIFQSCDGRPPQKIRVISEEGRFLLIELMGYLLALYRSYHNRRLGSFKSTSPTTRSPTGSKPAN